MGLQQSTDGTVTGLCDCAHKQKNRVRTPGTSYVGGIATPRAVYHNAHSGKLGPELVCRRDGGSLLHLSAARGDNFSVVAFVRGGHFHVNTRDNLGRTPLMLAAYFGAAPTVKLLYELGASINMEDCSGKTALMLSVEQEAWEVADWIKWQVRL